MGHQNREIEVKLLVGGEASWSDVEARVVKLLGARVVDTIIDKSGDDYWSPKSARRGLKVAINHRADGKADVVFKGRSGEARMVAESGSQAEALFGALLWGKSGERPVADFLRIREEEKTGRAIVTVKGKDIGGNFNRIEIDMQVSRKADALAFFVAFLGEKQGSIVKKYNVYFLDEEETNVSLYQIEGSPLVFIEVEARTEEKVFGLCSELVGKLGLPLSRVKNSLYDIFICGEAPRLKPLSSRDLRRALAEAS